jgi:DNA-binding winged helix-turn-helix (wHTH) protein
VRVRFGEFTLDTERRQLWQGDPPSPAGFGAPGVERHLSPKAFDLLRLIVDNRPRVLSKAELHQQLWPSTFVSEATLSSLVAEVREALGEKLTARRRFIRTAHRVGYAFDGETTELPPSTADLRARCWIVWEAGEVALGDGEHLLGRDSDVAICLESPTVSRHHARIRVDGDSATLEDLGSKNGTRLAGRPVTAPSPVNDGDQIQLGSVLVTFRRMRTGDATDETQEFVI